jgi:hypothetical protein
MAVDEGLEHVVDRDVAGHAIMRWNHRLAVEARAQIEVGRHRDISRHRLHIESAEEAGIDPDVGKLILLCHHLGERGRERLQRVVREAPEDDNATGLRSVRNHLAKRLGRHRQACEDDELRRITLLGRHILRGALDDLVEVERAIAVHWQIGLGQIGQAIGALLLDGKGFLPEGFAASLDVIGKGLGVFLHRGRALAHRLEVKAINILGDSLDAGDCRNTGYGGNHDGSASHRICLLE